MPNTILVEHLSKQYRDADRLLTVINDLSFEFPCNTSIAIIGRSGIGKSTLLHLLGGLDRPSAGSVRIGETRLELLDADGLAAFRCSSVGFVFQFHHLLPEFSAEENVAMPLLIAGHTRQKALKAAGAALVLVGLEHRLKHRPGQLSGGEQQRVAVARAVVHRPNAILADEPTGNLDVNTAKAVQELLLKVQREIGGTLIVVTHSQELASSMDMVVEMLPGGELQSSASTKSRFR